MDLDTKPWTTHQDYRQDGITWSAEKFLEVNNLLLENPNLNSTHLFRADILYDSAHLLKTTTEKENACSGSISEGKAIDSNANSWDQNRAWKSPVLNEEVPERTVIRRLIPRKPQLDRPLEQTCYVYRQRENVQVVFIPHVHTVEEIPWYHPPIQALAYQYTGSGENDNGAALSIHYLPFSTVVDKIVASDSRLHRTFLSLLQTFLRLAKHPGKTAVTEDDSNSLANNHSNGMPTLASALKDTIIPQHLVQDTYSRLKQQYASDLISRWIEKTEPSKHVFEDLSIAAFLIELWKQMYSNTIFPGFVDIACGNGVLVYILHKEGYQGKGFDARRRKTWEVLEIDEYLEEQICVPKPFLDALDEDIGSLLPKTNIHNGIFPTGTFIISNHADELTPWTPILAALSSPILPLPFLAIPCCSHALSGAKHRYSPKTGQNTYSSSGLNGTEPQSLTGDLRSLRAERAKAALHADDKSMYSCLTKKVVAIAEGIGFDVELTLMRIPSTRNIGIVGNRRYIGKNVNSDGSENIVRKVEGLIEAECKMSGGVSAAAKTWIKRAQKLQIGKGRGKVNLGGKPEHD